MSCLRGANWSLRGRSSQIDFLGKALVFEGIAPFGASQDGVEGVFGRGDKILFSR